MTMTAVRLPFGYARLHREQVLQADLGCDLDFLRAVPNRSP